MRPVEVLLIVVVCITELSWFRAQWTKLVLYWFHASVSSLVFTIGDARRSALKFDREVQVHGRLSEIEFGPRLSEYLLGNR